MLLRLSTNETLCQLRIFSLGGLEPIKIEKEQQKLGYDHRNKKVHGLRCLLRELFPSRSPPVSLIGQVVLCLLQQRQKLPILLDARGRSTLPG